MEKEQIISFIKLLNGNLNIYICGPQYNDRHLRVYAYGGLLCKLPTTTRMGIRLLYENYLEDLTLRMTLQGVKGSGNEKKEEFLRKHLDELLPVMESRFTSKNNNVCEERNQQTTISREHADFHRHNGTVVCDFQSSIPQVWLPDGMSRPAFDMVTFSMDEAGNGVFTLVELKCNKASCEGKSGLKKHARDMRACMQYPGTSDLYKGELLHRLDYMLQYGLLQDCPTGLESPNRLSLENTCLRSAFLFIVGAGVECRADAVALCKKYIPDNLDDFLYCFAKSPQEADLSRMEHWGTFSGGQ